MPEVITVLRCSNCGALDPGPRTLCPACGAAALKPEQVDGRGKLITWTAIRRPPAGREDLGAYRVAVVALNDGVQVTGRLAPDTPDLAAAAPVTCIALQDNVPIFAGTTDG